MITLIGLVRRKPGLSSAAFRDHYESTHAPLAARLLGQDVVEYRRCYPKAGESFAIAQFMDNKAQGDRDVKPLQFDCVTIFRFRDEAQVAAFNAARSKPGINDQLVADESQFMDRDASLAIFMDEGVSKV